LETCDTAGILSPIINVIASIQACEALKILAGRREAVSRVMQVFDLWDNRVRQVKLDGLREAMGECPACSGRDYPWWDGRRGSQSAVLCGRNSVQLSFPDQPRHDFSALAPKLAAVGNISQNRYLLRLTVDRYTITLFPDGRAIVGGTSDVAEARSAYARYIGL
jgi:adenylyltransferase/sulfurtransferase